MVDRSSIKTGSRPGPAAGPGRDPADAGHRPASSCCMAAAFMLLQRNAAQLKSMMGEVGAVCGVTPGARALPARSS